MPPASQAMGLPCPSTAYRPALGPASPGTRASRSRPCRKRRPRWRAAPPLGRWLLDQGYTRDATWPGIRAWLAANPQRTNELMWTNPRYVFFREEPLNPLDAGFGPRGAQGVPLTPGRSIAVDRQSIPYGTPVWLASSGPQGQLNRMVLAQDTGSAILGAVRADFFTGWGPEAGDIAGRLKQNLRLWALWPR